MHLAELATQLEDMVTTEPPVPVADAIALCKAQKAEWNLPEVEILKVRAGDAWTDRMRTCLAVQSARHLAGLDASAGPQQSAAALLLPRLCVSCQEAEMG